MKKATIYGRFIAVYLLFRQNSWCETSEEWIRFYFFWTGLTAPVKCGSAEIGSDPEQYLIVSKNLTLPGQ